MDILLRGFVQQVVVQTAGFCVLVLSVRQAVAATKDIIALVADATSAL